MVQSDTVLKPVHYTDQCSKADYEEILDAFLNITNVFLLFFYNFYNLIGLKLHWNDLSLISI